MAHKWAVGHSPVSESGGVQEATVVQVHAGLLGDGAAAEGREGAHHRDEELRKRHPEVPEPAARSLQRR